MRISVIAKHPTWHTRALLEEAEKLSVDLSVQDISSKEEISGLGDIVIWRSASVSRNASQRSAAFQLLMKKRVFFNWATETLPQVTDKFFQQSYLKKKAPFIDPIPSFKFESKTALLCAIQDGIITYPFIQKPLRGAKGKGIHLITNSNDIESYCQVTNSFIYQPYIKNRGDYRALILGGKMLGVIRRQSVDGNFLNNISQGGVATNIDDPTLLKNIERIATTAACVFELTFCGVDIIEDLDGKLFFLEINTVPQWQGFQSATGVNVARELIRFCLSMAKRNETSLQNLIADYYWESLPFLESRKFTKFHFVSRLHLWNPNPRTQEEIEALRSWFLFGKEEAISTHLKKRFEEPFVLGPNSVERSLRTKYFSAYPSLAPYNKLLFARLFSASLYQEDLKKEVASIVSSESFVALYQQLLADHQALIGLSTHAINYLYLVNHFFLPKENVPRLDPSLLLRIGEDYFITKTSSMKLGIYYFTHCIIAASLFYSQKIDDHKKIYVQMLSHIEKMISEDFEALSLDTKLEFLICTRLLQITSPLERKIMDEASHSLSPFGNFLVDTFNANKEKQSSLAHSEHRNVLFLMASNQFYPA